METLPRKRDENKVCNRAYWIVDTVNHSQQEADFLLLKINKLEDFNLLCVIQINNLAFPCDN